MFDLVLILLYLMLVAPVLIIGMVVGLHYLASSPGSREPLPAGLRWVFWAFAAFYLIQLSFWVALGSREDPLAFLIFFSLLSLALLLFAYPVIRWQLISRTSLVVQPDTLLQLSAGGDEIARVDLTQPYELRASYVGLQKAMYVVRQGSVRLRFTSGDRAAEAAAQALQIEWPPTGRIAGL